MKTFSARNGDCLHHGLKVFSALFLRASSVIPKNKLDVILLMRRKASRIRSNRLGANTSAFPQEDNVFRFNLLGVDDFVSLNM